MTIICKECGADFLDDEGLHRHLKAHKIKTPDYYIKHFNRKDFYSNEPIPFKNKTQYFDNDFVSKTNLRLWLKNQGKEIQKEYCKNLLQKRIEKKGIKFAPTQVELRSLLIPSVNYYEILFNGYYKLCTSLGLELKFSSYPDILNFTSIEKKIQFIRQDSREQNPLNLNFPIEITNLNFGDYSIDNPGLNENVFIERKSLSDYIGTFGRNIERFTNELERAELNNAYLVVLVEDTIEHAMYFDHLPYIYAKMCPDAIFHNVRELLQRYNNLQFIFCNGRKESSRILKRILFEKGLARNLDLELCYEIGVI